MSTTTTAESSTAEDGFDLDIQLIETSDRVGELLASTDDGCGASCPNACTTSYI